MTKCNRCLRSTDGIHTCTPAIYKSKCHQARVYLVAGNKRYMDIEELMVERGKTYYYQCSECEKPCDAEKNYE